MKKVLFLLLLLLFPFGQASAYDKSIVDITKLSITEIQDSIDKGYLTYERLIKLYLDRIDAYETDYNALISINENALEEARKCDQIYKEKGRDSLLFGIPIILKDNIDFKGLPTTAGSTALKDSIPYENAKVVDNLISKGAIILAKANMSEFAFRASNSYSSYGSVKNAYNNLYTPYGSSGGSAVAVALSFAPISLGTDTNSSVRLPASANNVIGLRPTTGLIQMDGVMPYDVTRDTIGPISKRVADNAILFTALANNGKDYTLSLKKDGLVGKKIGVLRQFYTADSNANLNLLNAYDKTIEDLMKAAIKKMEEAGATIIYLDDFYNNTLDTYFDRTVFGASLCYQFNQYIKGTKSQIQSFNSLINSFGYVQNLKEYNVYCNTDLLKDDKYLNIMNLKDEFASIIKDKMTKAGVDVLIYPNTKNKLLKLNEDENNLVNNTYIIAPTAGFPAISVPLGFDEDNLPYGMDILTFPNKEDLLYEVAYAYEQLGELKTPKDAPNLYEIPDYIINLKELYEANLLDLTKYSKKRLNEFKPIYEEVRNILTDYNNYDGSEEYVLNVTKEYKESLKKIKRITFGQIIGSITLILIIIYLILYSIRLKNIRKKRRLRNRRHV